MRTIARVLKDSPGGAAELQSVLQNVLQRNTQHGVTQGTTGDAVLHDVLQRLAALEQRQAALERHDREEGPTDSVSPAGRKPEGATDGGPFVAGAAPEEPAFPKESEGTLWQGIGSTRRLTAHGRQVLAGYGYGGFSPGGDGRPVRDAVRQHGPDGPPDVPRSADHGRADGKPGSRIFLMPPAGASYFG